MISISGMRIALLSVPVSPPRLYAEAPVASSQLPRSAEASARESVHAFDFFGQALHPQLLRCRERGGQQTCCLLAIAGVIARQQHVAVVALCVRHPRPRAHARVHVEGVLEMVCSGVPTAQRRRKDAEIARGGAVTNDLSARDVALGVRQQESVERARTADIA